MKLALPFFTAAALATALGACSGAFEPGEVAYACDDDDDCLPGFRCEPVATAEDLKLCTPAQDGAAAEPDSTTDTATEPDGAAPEPDPATPAPEPDVALADPEPDVALADPEPDLPLPEPEAPSPEPEAALADPEPDDAAGEPEPELPSPEPELPSPDPEDVPPDPDPLPPEPEPELPSPEPEVPAPDPTPEPETPACDESTLACPCFTGADCQSGACTLLPPTADHVCAVPCDSPGGCPAKFLCTATGADAVPYLCLPPTVRKCQPCEVDEDCSPLGGVPGDKCHDFGGTEGKRCLLPCDLPGGCPPGFSCQDVGGSEQCFPTSGKCGPCEQLSKDLGLPGCN